MAPWINRLRSKIADADIGLRRSELSQWNKTIRALETSYQRWAREPIHDGNPIWRCEAIMAAQERAGNVAEQLL